MKAFPSVLVTLGWDRELRGLTRFTTMSSIAVALHDGWTLRQVARRNQAPVVDPVPATVPGCVHTDLLAAAVIPDPFRDSNERALGWVGEGDWGYSCRFDVTDEMLAHGHLDLAADGLDTLARITVNGHVIGETANMHRRYRFDVKDYVRLGANDLDIVFRSATVHCDDLVRTEGIWPSAYPGRPFNYLRKMACSWGWDWGPWLTTAGIWRRLALEAWTAGRIGDIRTHTTVEPSGDGHIAIEVEVEVDNSGAPEAGLVLDAELRDPDGARVAGVSVPVVDPTTRFDLGPGPVTLWWPHTHGGQPLYELEVRLTSSSGVHASERVHVGFRTIWLDTTPDATGSNFTFVVNDVPMFVRGVNWIPDDVFVSQVTEGDLRTRLQQAVDANADMVRVWGGGIYEDDRFYSICDELGLLVWQDFLFACAAYPEHLLAGEVAAEARDNVSRLMHHPSLAVWNGNNENVWGYWDWGWQDVLQGRPWGAGFYHDLLPGIVDELDPDRPYVPASPWSGSPAVAPNADAHGCTHVWDVWNQLDLDRYRDHTPRFVSEFGWQAPPSWVTLADVLSTDSLRRDSTAMADHQKADDGDRKLDRGIRPRFGDVDDLDAFWYAAHVVQARAVRTGVEHFRSLRPHCMGTIWWQLNDCWPVASWALVDSAGRRKPSWFALRSAYRPRLLTLQPRGDALVLYAVNDSDARWRLDTTIRRIAFDGTVLASEPAVADIAPGSSWSMPVGPDAARPGDGRCELLVAGHGDGKAEWWYEFDRELDLVTPRLTIDRRVDQTAGSSDLVLSLTSDTVVRDLVVYPERIAPDAVADRQLVTLLPGVTETIRVSGVGDGDVGELLTRPVFWHVAALLAN